MCTFFLNGDRSRETASKESSLGRGFSRPVYPSRRETSPIHVISVDRKSATRRIRRRGATRGLADLLVMWADPILPGTDVYRMFAVNYREKSIFRHGTLIVLT